MDDLEELTNRTTIKFPFSINAEEIEDTLFEYLRVEVHCKIDHSVLIMGNRGQGDDDTPTSKRYASKITAAITRRTVDFVTSSFKLLDSGRSFPNFFNAIEFDVLDYGSIEEFRGMPTGEAQLILIDSVREKVGEYFHQRDPD